MSLIDGLNKVFESRIRIGIMAVLLVNENVDFNRLKQLLEVTDGNLSSHLSALEKSKYIEVKKQFIGKRPNTSFVATKTGKDAFNDHLKKLEELLKS